MDGNTAREDIAPLKTSEMSGTAPRSPRRTTAQRRAQIAQAALECLIQDGPVGLTARRVAAKAGISLGHLTYHFTNMDEVTIETYHLVAAQLAQTDPIDDLKGLSPTDRLIKYLQSVYAPQTLTKTRIALRLNMWSAAQTNPAIAEIERALHDTVRSKIESHLIAICDPWKTGRIPMVEAFMMAMLDGLWLDYMRHGDLEAIDAAIDAAGQFAKIRLGGS